jgi:hypothetical protein
MGCRGASQLEVPRFIKDSMVTRFHNPRIQIEVCYILVGCRVAKEDAGKIMLIQFASSGARAFDANPRPERFEMGNV